MSYTRRPQWAEVSLRLPRLRRTRRVRSRRASSMWEWYTRYPGHPSTLVQSVCMSIPVRGSRGHHLRESAKLQPRSTVAVGRCARYTNSLKSVKRGGQHTQHSRRRRCSAQGGPLQLSPFPSLSGLFRTARSGQGRAGFARRSEPLTARTVLEDGAEGKGGGVAGVSPAGFGAAPQFYARERTRSTTKKPELPTKPTFIADSCAQPNNLREVRDHIKDKIDTFLNAYLSVNPKKCNT